MNIAFAGFRHGHIFTLYKQAKNHPDIHIAAAWEENDEARKEAESRGVTFNCVGYDDMLTYPGIDAVAIGDYYGIRGERVIKALKAGKHVVADKPICTTLAELDEIERLSSEKNLKVGCMLDLRYLRSAAAAKEIISGGRLGKIHAICFGGQHSLNYGTRAKWYFEKGKHGGTINDIAVHGIDLIRYITGLELEDIIAARCWNAFAREVKEFKDCAQFMAVFGGGAGLIADVSYSLPEGCGFDMTKPWRFTFWGENGVLEFDANSDTILLEMAGADAPEIIKSEPSSSNTIIDFLADINGVPNELDTENVFKSSRSTLMIQDFANKSEGDKFEKV
jgi:predicted dehydrogenase